MLIRIPWRRRQTGFVVTHLGILVLLAGCLLTQRAGIEAQLPIFEGHAAHRAYQESYHFQLRDRTATMGRKNRSRAVYTGPFAWDQYASLSWFPWAFAYRDEGTIYDAMALASKCSTIPTSRALRPGAADRRRHGERSSTCPPRRTIPPETEAMCRGGQKTPRVGRLAAG